MSQDKIDEKEISRMAKGQLRNTRLSRHCLPQEKAKAFDEGTKAQKKVCGGQIFHGQGLDEIEYNVQNAPTVMKLYIKIIAAGLATSLSVHLLILFAVWSTCGKPDVAGFVIMDLWTLLGGCVMSGVMIKHEKP